MALMNAEARQCAGRENVRILQQAHVLASAQLLFAGPTSVQDTLGCLGEASHMPACKLCLNARSNKPGVRPALHCRVC